MWLRAPTVRKLLLEVNRTIEAQSSVGQDINIECFVISRSVDKTNVAGLDEVVGDDDVFLVRGDFYVVGSDGGLDFIGVIESLDIV